MVVSQPRVGPHTELQVAGIANQESVGRDIPIAQQVGKAYMMSIHNQDENAHEHDYGEDGYVQ